MLSDREWGLIRQYTDLVCNREADDVAIRGGRITREPGEDIIIRLNAGLVDLEPFDGAGQPGGVGWPE